MKKLAILFIISVLIFLAGCGSNAGTLPPATSNMPVLDAVSGDFCIKNDQGEVIITSVDVIGVDRFSDEHTEYGVIIYFNENGTEKFYEMTKRNIGKTSFIYVGGQLVQAPLIVEEIDEGSTILRCSDKETEDELFNLLTK